MLALLTGKPIPHSFTLVFSFGFSLGFARSAPTAKGEGFCGAYPDFWPPLPLPPLRGVEGSSAEPTVEDGEFVVDVLFRVVESESDERPEGDGGVPAPGGERRLELGGVVVVIAGGGTAGWPGRRCCCCWPPGGPPDVDRVCEGGAERSSPGCFSRERRWPGALGAVDDPLSGATDEVEVWFLWDGRAEDLERLVYGLLQNHHQHPTMLAARNTPTPTLTAIVTIGTPPSCCDELLGLSVPLNCVEVTVTTMFCLLAIAAATGSAGWVIRGGRAWSALVLALLLEGVGMGNVGSSSAAGCGLDSSSVVQASGSTMRCFPGENRFLPLRRRS